MGLIKMITGAVQSELADQIREYIYCDALENEVLMRKGQVRNLNGKTGASKFGFTNNASDNIISKGSAIAVNEGQFMIVVEDGEIIDFTDEAGDYIFDKGSEPSMLYGSFGEGLLESFKQVGKRFTFGGDTGKDQRVYFINKKLIMNNKFGTPAPIPFRDPEFSITINLTCNGTYVFRIKDPLIFYKNLCGNVSDEYVMNDTLKQQFKSDLVSALRPALAKLSMQKIPFDFLAASQDQMCAALQEVLYQNWEVKTGINVDRININNLDAVHNENYDKLMNFQAGRVYTDPNMVNAMQAQAKTGWIDGMAAGAAQPSSGTAGDPVNGVMGMMGMNMMNQMMNQMNPTQPNTNFGQTAMPGPAVQTAPVAAATAAQANAWTCNCGAQNTNNFCANCGGQKPQVQETWTCNCGNQNNTNFCANCGTKKSDVIKKLRCDKCGFEPEKPTNFCPKCGDVFNDLDVK